MSGPGNFWDSLQSALRAGNAERVRSILKDEHIRDKNFFNNESVVIGVLCWILRTRRPQLLKVLLDDLPPDGHGLSQIFRSCLVRRHNGNPFMGALIAGQPIGSPPSGAGTVDSNVSKMVNKLLDTVHYELGSQSSKSTTSSRLVYGEPSSGQQNNLILNDRIIGYGNPVPPAELADFNRLYETASILKRRTSPNLAQPAQYQAQKRPNSN